MGQNWWKLLTIDPEGKKVILKHGSVADAVAQGKSLKQSGFTVEIISGSKGYPPQSKAGPRPSSKHYWCPYCIKWRVYRSMAVRRNGLRGPEDMRCPVCLISVHDYYVRRYNGMMEQIDMETLYRMEVTFERSD